MNIAAADGPLVSGWGLVGLIVLVTALCLPLMLAGAKFLERHDDEREE